MAGECEGAGVRECSGGLRIYRLMVFQNQCFFKFLFYEDFGSIWGTLWGTILVKNQEKCVAKTGLREVAKRVRKKR